MTTPLKIIFVGDGASGKTCATNKLMRYTINSHRPYEPTHGAEVHRYINKRGTILDIWDCGGAYSGFGDAYFIDADICVIFGSNQYTWMRYVKRIAGDIIFYNYSTYNNLKKFIESINNLGPVCDEEQTVIYMYDILQ